MAVLACADRPGRAAPAAFIQSWKKPSPAPRPAKAWDSGAGAPDGSVLCGREVMAVSSQLPVVSLIVPLWRGLGQSGWRHRIIGAFMQRRALFSHLSRLAAALAWQQVCAQQAQARGQQPPQGGWQTAAEVFTLGVASGEPRPDSVVIWTRLAPLPLQADGGMPAQAVPVRWEVASDARFSRVLQTGSAVADPAAAHSVRVEVKGLPSGQPCYYRFEAGGQRSPVGRTRTAPDPGERNTRMRVALASCQHYETGFYTVHREIAASDVDLVLFVGDYIYGTQAKPYARVRRHPHVMPDLHRRTLADYRRHYASYKLDPDLRACHAAHPWLMVWDDHEVSADYTGRHSPDLKDPQAFLAVRTAAYQAYFEHMPFSPHRAPVAGSMPLHGRYPWGRLVDLMTVDTRQFRDPPVCAGRHAPMQGKLLWQCDAAQAPERTMLGQSQGYDLAAQLAPVSVTGSSSCSPLRFRRGCCAHLWGPCSMPMAGMPIRRHAGA